MSIIKHNFLIAFLFLTGNLSALDFQKEKLSYFASLNEYSYTATFYFTNNGSQEVNIKALTPSCNCLAPKLTKKNYKPGEKGVIKLVFDFKNKKGLQQNRLLVYVKGKEEPITLVLEVNIPYPYNYSKRFHTWKGQDKKQKKITMTLHKDLKAKVSLMVLKEDFPFKVGLTETKDGKYDISLQPKEKIRKGRYKVNLKIEEKNKRPKTSSIYLLIQ
jgi:hypothetical protein